MTETPLSSRRQSINKEMYTEFLEFKEKLNEYDDIMDFQNDQECDVEQTGKPELNENSWLRSRSFGNGMSKDIVFHVRNTGINSPLFKSPLKR